MSAQGLVKFAFASFVIIGGAWQLYCMSPAGAAEREHTRLQNEMARQALEEKNTPKRNI